MIMNVNIQDAFTYLEKKVETDGRNVSDLMMKMSDVQIRLHDMKKKLEELEEIKVKESKFINVDGRKLG